MGAPLAFPPTFSCVRPLHAFRWCSRLTPRVGAVGTAHGLRSGETAKAADRGEGGRHRSHGYCLSGALNRELTLSSRLYLSITTAIRGAMVSTLSFGTVF